MGARKPSMVSRMPHDTVRIVSAAVEGRSIAFRSADCRDEILAEPERFAAVFCTRRHRSI